MYVCFSSKQAKAPEEKGSMIGQVGGVAQTSCEWCVFLEQTLPKKTSSQARARDQTKHMSHAGVYVL